MNRLIVLLLAAGMMFAACEKLDLKRDNPLDQYNQDNFVAGVEIHYDGYKVRGDGNGDGVINKGERVQLDVALKNIGTSKAQGVKAIFSTASEYVSNFSPMMAVEYKDIMAGYISWSGGHTSSVVTAFGFTVSEEAPSGTTIPIKIDIEDEYGNQWEDSLSLTVENTGARIGYNSYEVRSDGNGDGIINKGERIQLDVALKNSGTSKAQGVKATFSTASEYVSNFSPMMAVEYKDIMAGYISWSGGHSSSVFTAFGFTVSEEAPSGTTIPIKIDIEDEYGNQWESEFTLNVQ
ncbi:MAG: hypothetical protein K2G46_07945 [Bacteroidales bacterium]|nr:hypothetical protein [Bacteroidales bacterium]